MILPDDPNISVQKMKAGDPAPADGWWLNSYTLDLLIAKAKGASE